VIPRHAIGPYGDCKDWCERCRRARDLGIPMDADDLDFLAADVACTWRGKVCEGIEGDCEGGLPPWIELGFFGCQRLPYRNPLFPEDDDCDDPSAGHGFEPDDGPDDSICRHCGSTAMYHRVDPDPLDAANGGDGPWAPVNPARAPTDAEIAACMDEAHHIWRETRDDDSDFDVARIALLLAKRAALTADMERDRNRWRAYADTAHDLMASFFAEADDDLHGRARRAATEINHLRFLLRIYQNKINRADVAVDPADPTRMPPAVALVSSMLAAAIEHEPNARNYLAWAWGDAEGRSYRVRVERGEGLPPETLAAAAIEERDEARRMLGDARRDERAAVARWLRADAADTRAYAETPECGPNRKACLDIAGCYEMAADDIDRKMPSPADEVADG
jgi:hypothetical protein